MSTIIWLADVLIHFVFQSVTQPFDYLLRVANVHYYVLPTTCHYLNNLIEHGAYLHFVLPSLATPKN